MSGCSTLHRVNGEGRVGLAGTFELTREGQTQQFELAWAGPSEFVLSSEGWTVVTWDREGWIAHEGGIERFHERPKRCSCPSIGRPVSDLLEVEAATRLEIVRSGTPTVDTNRVRWKHGSATGVLDLALGVVVELDHTEFSFRSEFHIADLEPPTAPSKPATFFADGPPSLVSDRWSGYLGLDLDGGVTHGCRSGVSPLVPSWDAVLVAGRTGRLEIHSVVSEATFDLWDLVGATYTLPDGLDLDQALGWYASRGCASVHVAIDTPDDLRTWFIVRGQQVEGPFDPDRRD